MYNKSLIFFRVWFWWWQSETASSFCHRKTKKKTVSSFVRWVRVTAIIRRRSRSRSPRQHPHVGGRGHVLRLLALTSPNCTRYPFFTLCMCVFIIHIFARKIFILYELTVLRNISHCFWPGYWYRYHNQKKKKEKKAFTNHWERRNLMSLFLLQIDLFGDDFNEVFTGSKVSAGMLLLSLKLFFFFFFFFIFVYVCLLWHDADGFGSSKASCLL